MLNYTKFTGEHIPSDTRMKMLFPNDVELRTNYQDVLTKWNLLFFYRHTITLSHETTEGDPQRDKFYSELVKEIQWDCNEVETEFDSVLEQAPHGTLQMWEYDNLDQDGGTKRLEEALRSGQDVFHNHQQKAVQAAIEKYGRLIPSGYWDKIQRERLECWEDGYLDEDGGTTRIQKTIERGNGESKFSQNNGGDEARAKYGYLLDQAAQLENDKSTGAILESIRNLFLDPLPHTSSAVDPKHDLHAPIPQPSRTSTSTLVPHLAFLLLLPLELYLTYHAYTEWMA